MLRHTALPFALLCLLACPPSHAQQAASPASAASAPADEVLRAELGPSMQAADAAIKASNWAEALVKLEEAGKFPNLTPYESYLILRMRAVAHARSDQLGPAVKALEGVINHPKLPKADRRAILQALADYSFRIKDYPAAATWARQFFAEGHQNTELHLLLGQALYLNKDYPGAMAELQKHTLAVEAAGKQAPENSLKIWAASAHQAKDNTAYVAVLKRLLALYPSEPYWADLLSRIESRQGFPERLFTDSLRLRRTLGMLGSAGDYEDLAELTQRAGFPAEAQAVMEEGFAKGVLGKGSDAAKQQKLREAVTRKATEDRKDLAQPDGAAARVKDGDALVRLGYAVFTSGQKDKGLQLMEQGIARPDLKRGDEARLMLGYAQFQSGAKAKAVATFKAVSGDPDAMAVAEAWSLHAARP